jgi:opacity protein-like surface antigen
MFVQIQHSYAGPAGNAVSGDVAMKGSAAFGVLYLPVPILDVYVKAGLARIQSTARTTVTLTGPILCIVEHPQCQFSQQHDATNIGFAAGAGVQYKLGSWAVRAVRTLQCGRRTSQSSVARDRLDVLLA